MVSADAAMVERVVSVDASDGADERYSKAPARHKAAARGAPSAREIEGMGGRFFYEGA